MNENEIRPAGRRTAAAECEEVSVQLAAYLVHLVWRDLARWDDRRRLRRDEAEAFAERLAMRLPPEMRAKLAALRTRAAA